MIRRSWKSEMQTWVSYYFDSAKFTPEKVEEWVQKQTCKDCPVFTRIDEVGLLTAAQRLYKHYGLTCWKQLKATNYPPPKMLMKKQRCKQMISRQRYLCQQISYRKRTSILSNLLKLNGYPTSRAYLLKAQTLRQMQ